MSFASSVFQHPWSFNNLSETALQALLLITAVAPPERRLCRPYSLSPPTQAFLGELVFHPSCGEEWKTNVLSILMVRGEASSTRREAPREKNNLWSQELRVSFPCNFRIKYLTKPCMFVFTDADSLDLIVRDSVSAMHDNRIARKLTLQRCIKSCHKFFS